MGKWRIIGKFIFKKKYLTVLALITGLCYNIITAIIPISFGKFYEFNFNFSSHRLKLLDGLPFITTGNFSHFVYFFIGLIFIRFLFEYLNRYFIGIIGESFSRSLREDLFAHQLQISTDIYEEKGIGKYLLRYTGDFKSIQNYLTKGIFKFSQDIILIAMLVIVVAYFNNNLALILLGFILLAFVLLFSLNTVLYKISLSKRNLLSGTLSFVNKVLLSILTIKSFNKNTPIESRYNKRSEKLFSAGVKYQNITAFIYSLVPFITYTMIAVVMIYIHSVKNNNNPFDQASLLILILVIITFLPIFRRILSINVTWKLGNISFSKLLNIYAYETESKLIQENIDLKKKPIVFNNVTWKNQNENLTFNLKIDPKSITFFKTDIGSKKTEIFIKLLLKIYKPSSGSILIGKHAYNTLTEKTIRKNITVISKLLPLEGRTVFEAISYSAKATKRKQCQEILDEFQQFVRKEDILSLDTKIGDNGVKLNDSQKQLLMWCRSLLTNKNTLVIDRSFNYINDNLKDHLYKKLNSLKKNKTVIVIDDNAPKDLLIDIKTFF